MKLTEASVREQDIFAEVSLPSESENSYLADFAPGKSLIFSKIRSFERYAYGVSLDGAVQQPLFMYAPEGSRIFMIRTAKERLMLLPVPGRGWMGYR